MIHNIKNRTSLISLILTICGCFIVIISSAYKLNQFYVGYSIIIPCLFFLVFKKSLVENLNLFDDQNNLHKYFLGLCIIFFVLLCFAFMLIFSYTDIYHRSFSYFIIMSFASAIIAIQIVFLKNKKYMWLILAEIFLLAFNIRWSNYYLFPGLQGVDPWYHAGFIQEIVSLGFISTNDYYIAYSHMPIMHLEVAIIEIITSLGLKNSYFFVGIIQIITCFFIFSFAQKIYGIKVGLLSILLLNVSDYFLKWGIQAAPMTVGFLFTFIILFFVLESSDKLGRKNVSTSSIIIFLLFVLLLTHPIASFITLIIILSVLIFSKATSYLQRRTINESLPKINISLVLIFSVSMILYWMNLFRSTAEYSFFDSAILSVKSALLMSNVGDVELVTQASKLDAIVVLANKAGYSILLSIAILGGLLTLSIRKDRALRTLLLTLVVILLFWTYIPALMGSNATLPDRWFLFVYPLLSIFGAFGLFSFVNKFRYMSLNTFLVFSIVFLLTFFMITNSITNSDSSIYPRDSLDDYNYSRNSYYESELSIGNFLIENYNGKIVSDIRFTNILQYWFKCNEVDSISLSNPNSYNNGLVLIRESIINGKISDRTTGYMFVYEKTPDTFKHELMSNQYDLIYNSNSIMAYRSNIK